VSSRLAGCAHQWFPPRPRGMSHAVYPSLTELVQ
jgi:hypothetical protein